MILNLKNNKESNVNRENVQLFSNINEMIFL
jgi:hypothetical protein